MDTKESYPIIVGSNPHKTLIAQKRRASAAETPAEIGDKIATTVFDNPVNSKVEVFKRPEGGIQIDTTINSHSALFSQSWRYNPQGELVRVDINKSLTDTKDPDNPKTIDIDFVTLERDPSNPSRFIATERKETLNAENYEDWESEFLTAQNRMDVAANKRVTAQQKTTTFKKPTLLHTTRK